jgi:hypothetical protein
MWHMIMHNECVVNILEGATCGKKAMGRPRLQYLQQVPRNTGADNYTVTKRMACNQSRRRAANQLRFKDNKKKWAWKQTKASETFGS